MMGSQNGFMDTQMLMAERSIRKNDNRDVVGLSYKDRKKLLETIPHKITDTMGNVADTIRKMEIKNIIYS